MSLLGPNVFPGHTVNGRAYTFAVGMYPEDHEAIADELRRLNLDDMPKLQEVRRLVLDALLPF